MRTQRLRNWDITYTTIRLLKYPTQSRSNYNYNTLINQNLQEIFKLIFLIDEILDSLLLFDCFIVKESYRYKGECYHWTYNTNPYSYQICACSLIIFEVTGYHQCHLDKYNSSINCCKSSIKRERIKQKQT